MNDDQDKRFALADQWWPGLLFWIVVVVIFAAINAKSCGAEVKLAWNPNPESDLSGYRLYRLGTPNLLLATTSATTATVIAFPGEEIAVAAFNVVGESGLSAPVTVPEPPPTTPLLDRTGWLVAAFSSEELVQERGAAAHAIDAAGPSTFWNSKWSERGPHSITLQLPRPALVSSLEYWPHQTTGDPDGYIQAWQLQSSTDGTTWEDWASGTWPNTQARKIELLPLRSVKFIRLWGSERYASASDLLFRGVYEPDDPVPMVRVTMQQSTALGSWTDIAHDPITVPKKAADFFRIKIEPTTTP